MTNENVLCGLSLSISKRCLNYNIRFSNTLFTRKSSSCPLPNLQMEVNYFILIISICVDFKYKTCIYSIRGLFGLK